MTEETRLVVSSDSSTSVETKTTTLPAEYDTQQLAQDVLTMLDVVTSRLELVSPHPKTARKVRSARTVPPELIFSMIAAHEELPGFQAIHRFDPEKARRVLDERETLRILAERVSLFLARLKYTNEARYQEIVDEALVALAVAKVRATHPDEGPLAARVEVLSRIIGRSNKSKKPKESKKKRKDPAE